MASTRVVKQANVACKLLEISMQVVAAVGTLLAIGAVVFGFFANEPWVYGPIQATENWQSILVGIIAGGWVAIQTLVVYAVLAYLDAKVEALGEEPEVDPVPPAAQPRQYPDSAD